MTPTFSLLYTSVRAPLIQPMLAEWMAKAANRGAIEVIIVTDAGDTASAAAAATVPGAKCLVQPDPPFCCVAGWNMAADNSTGTVLVQVTDDFSPPDRWDEKLLALQPAGWIHGEHVVHVDDGYVRDLCTLAIVTRKRFEKIGYLFYPDFLSMFSDTELTAVAKRDGVMLEAMHLLFEHKHPDCKKRDRDAVDLNHASAERWQQGEALFKRRQSMGFPIDVGPMAGAVTTALLEQLKYCCYIQATRNDFCLEEVCDRMREEGVNDFFFSVPDEYWGGRPTPQGEIDEVRAVADKVNQSGAKAHVMVHRVKTYRFVGDTRLRVETRVRNDALAWIRKSGFEHILIVDGDELWKRGTLRYIKEIVSTHQPGAIASLMTPVVGLPGYPIEGASDVAVAYIGRGASFKECRTPFGDQFRLQMPLIYHFTGVRRTMEQTILKHKDSGHYDDPDYAFDEFLEKVLPNIKPGFTHDWGKHKGIHFYKNFQIWKAVRHWYPSEISEIPQTLWPYLAVTDTQAVALA